MKNLKGNLVEIVSPSYDMGRESIPAGLVGVVEWDDGSCVFRGIVGTHSV